MENNSTCSATNSPSPVPPNRSPPSPDQKDSHILGGNHLFSSSATSTSPTQYDFLAYQRIANLVSRPPTLPPPTSTAFSHVPHTSSIPTSHIPTTHIHTANGGLVSIPSTTSHFPLPPVGLTSGVPLPPGSHAGLFPHDPLRQNGPMDVKEGSLGPLPPHGGVWPYPPIYYPYEGIPPYPFLSGYGLSFDSSPRKNATRETTATLKAWLDEHKKNPYPTKGEKIMLAIITKMTLTQVSTWFANARRRLKKERKLGWDPRGTTDDEDNDEDCDKEECDNDNANSKDFDRDFRDDEVPETPLTRHQSQSPSSTTGDHPIKPRIWSLADLAASPHNSTEATQTIAGKLSFHRPLHIDTSPYGRPLGSTRLTAPQEALLQVYAKSLGLAGPPNPPPHYANPHPSMPHPPPGFPSLPLAGGSSNPFVNPSSSLLSSSISRPIATRSLLANSSPHPSLSGSLFSSGARIMTASSSNAS